MALYVLDAVLEEVGSLLSSFGLMNEIMRENMIVIRQH